MPVDVVGGNEAVGAELRRKGRAQADVGEQDRRAGRTLRIGEQLDIALQRPGERVEKRAGGGDVVVARAA